MHLFDGAGKNKSGDCLILWITITCAFSMPMYLIAVGFALFGRMKSDKKMVFMHATSFTFYGHKREKQRGAKNANSEIDRFMNVTNHAGRDRLSWLFCNLSNSGTDHSDRRRA